jgi:hypothetical protein
VRVPMALGMNVLLVWMVQVIAAEACNKGGGGTRGEGYLLPRCPKEAPPYSAALRPLLSVSQVARTSMMARLLVDMMASAAVMVVVSAVVVVVVSAVVVVMVVKMVAGVHGGKAAAVCRRQHFQRQR